MAMLYLLNKANAGPAELHFTGAWPVSKQTASKDLSTLFRIFANFARLK